jgi:hypothetical protein
MYILPLIYAIQLFNNTQTEVKYYRYINIVF